jgi:hypothetical protein
MNRGNPTNRSLTSCFPTTLRSHRTRYFRTNHIPCSGRTRTPEDSRTTSMNRTGSPYTPSVRASVMSLRGLASVRSVGVRRHAVRDRDARSRQTPVTGTNLTQPSSYQVSGCVATAEPRDRAPDPPELPCGRGPAVQPPACGTSSPLRTLAVRPEAFADGAGGRANRPGGNDHLVQNRSATGHSMGQDRGIRARTPGGPPHRRACARAGSCGCSFRVCCHWFLGAQ